MHGAREFAGIPGRLRCAVAPQRHTDHGGRIHGRFEPPDWVLEVDTDLDCPRLVIQEGINERDDSLKCFARKRFQRHVHTLAIFDPADVVLIDVEVQPNGVEFGDPIE